MKAQISWLNEEVGIFPNDSHKPHQTFPNWMRLEDMSGQLGQESLSLVSQKTLLYCLVDLRP